MCAIALPGANSSWIASWCARCQGFNAGAYGSVGLSHFIEQPAKTNLLIVTVHARYGVPMRSSRWHLTFLFGIGLGDLEVMLCLFTKRKQMDPHVLFPHGPLAE